jgi:hypothetical protein
MNVGKTLALVATLGTIWGATYMHDRAHRYDLVAVGAASGGTQETAGDMEIRAFIIDHQTGKVWVSTSSVGFVGVPLMRVHCSADQIKSEWGCSESASQENGNR